MNKYILAVIGVIVIGVGILLFSALFTVHQTQQALVLQFGNPIRVVQDPGLHVKIPLVQNVQTFDSRILDLDPPAQEVILTDQKRINVDSFVRYKITDPLEFRKKALTDANFRQIFGGRLNAAVRAEVGKVFLGDMLSDKREDVMQSITRTLKKQATQFGIEVVDVRIGAQICPRQRLKLFTIECDRTGLQRRLNFGPRVLKLRPKFKQRRIKTGRLSSLTHKKHHKFSVVKARGPGPVYSIKPLGKIPTFLNFTGQWRLMMRPSAKARLWC